MLIKTLTLVGLSLQFFAFWFAAPEIMGAEWLKKTDKILRKTISTIPQILMFIGGLSLGFFLYNTFSSWVTMIIILPVLVLYVYYQKKIPQILDRWIATPLLNRLILNSDFRFFLLKLAALLFTVGFILQIYAIVIS